MTQARVFAKRIVTDLGDLFAVVDEQGALKRLEFCDTPDRALDDAALEELSAAGFEVHWTASKLRQVESQLRAYLKGKRRTFELAVEPSGSPFQKRVWRQLLKIPYGKVLSYKQLASRLRMPQAPRAVGRANATNPISIVVPCHRVVGSSGRLTGYSGGLERKNALLQLEGHRLSADRIQQRTGSAAR